VELRHTGKELKGADALSCCESQATTLRESHMPTLCARHVHEAGRLPAACSMQIVCPSSRHSLNEIRRQGARSFAEFSFDPVDIAEFHSEPDTHSVR